MVKINWHNKKAEQKFAKISLKDFSDFWDLEKNKPAMQLKSMRKHIDKKTNDINRQMTRITVNDEIFYLKQAQGVSYESIINEYEAARHILNFGLRSADLDMHAFDDQARRGFLLYANLKNFYSLSNLISRNAPTEVIDFFMSRRHDYFLRISGIIRKVHKAGYYFPDWVAWHIFIKKDSDEIALIDLERFLPLKKWPWYFRVPIIFYFKRIKVWKKLLCSLESDLFPGTELKQYFCEQRRHKFSNN
ncbi:lipopolysaccharide kinase InaA family protein [Desulfosarcina sp. BuS5]|nr:lipopolysaccharide kinase InaA family protein [Desulfosarcina sp. BuS5]